MFLDIFSALESGYKGYLLHLSEEGWCPLKTGKSDRIYIEMFFKMNAGSYT